ncbi:MAG: hypothetical protein A3B65_07215 [Acidobacteria bacterium RIFCSPHIGHO2_02_FULL_67_57]|nr:MAG: hypothetical protein A3B65_07215 [Acidobacteria bacterium RIFCSPHIGHO2_02_FULL_67_57]
MAGRVLRWICRFVLGGLFLYAGFTKVFPPEHRFLFEMTVSAYRLLPEWGVIVVARALPWLEMGLGLVLMFGWLQRYVAAFVALLLGFFIVVMSITYARGVEVNCGCFGFGEAVSPLTLARDSGLLLMAVYLAVTPWRRPPPAS